MLLLTNHLNVHNFLQVEIQCKLGKSGNNMFLHFSFDFDVVVNFKVTEP
jgi:hypothetical protein